MGNEGLGDTGAQPNEAYKGWTDLDNPEQSDKKQRDDFAGESMGRENNAKIGKLMIESVDNDETVKAVDNRFRVVYDSLANKMESAGHEVDSYERERITRVSRELTRRDNDKPEEIQLDFEVPLEGLESLPQAVFEEYTANTALAAVFQFNSSRIEDNGPRHVRGISKSVTSIPKDKLTPTVMDFFSDANKWLSPNNKEFNVTVLPDCYVNGTIAREGDLESIGGKKVHHPGRVGIIGFDRHGDAMYEDSSYDTFDVPAQKLVPAYYEGNHPDFKRKAYVLQKVAAERMVEMEKKQEYFHGVPWAAAEYKTRKLAMREIIDNSYKQLTPDVITDVYYNLAKNDDEDVRHTVAHSLSSPLELRRTMQQQEYERYMNYDPNDSEQVFDALMAEQALVVKNGYWSALENNETIWDPHGVAKIIENVKDSGQNGVKILRNLMDTNSLFDHKFCYMLAAFDPSEEEFALKALGEEKARDSSFSWQVEEIRRKYGLPHTKPDSSNKGYFGSMMEEIMSED